MENHPDYGLTLLKDNYNAFQADSFNKEECTKLRADKWKTCHPHNSDLQPCTADMTIDELQSLFKQHQSCYQFRAAENQSLCFDKPDPGHIKAEQVELHHVKQCRLLIDAKSVSNAKRDTTKDTKIEKTITNAKIDRKEKKTDTTKQTKKSKIDTPPQQKQIESIHSKSQIKYKWWVYVLGIIAIIGLGFFLFYVY